MTPAKTPFFYTGLPSLVISKFIEPNLIQTPTPQSPPTFTLFKIHSPNDHDGEVKCLVNGDRNHTWTWDFLPLEGED